MTDGTQRSRHPGLDAAGPGDDSSHGALGLRAHAGAARRRRASASTPTRLRTLRSRGSTALEVRKTGKQLTSSPSTQHHFSMEGRDLVRVGTLDEFTEESRLRPGKSARLRTQPTRCTPPYTIRRLRVGHGDRSDACIGCNACVVACQAENNIPVVGKDQVLRRPRDALDSRSTATYAGGSKTIPETYHQPVPCMHCENAPCELSARSAPRCTATKG